MIFTFFPSYEVIVLSMLKFIASLYFFLLTELQLKPNHVPFKLACYWEELLEKYTTTEEDDRERGIHLFQV